jgi:hypothetical protein
MSFNRFTSARDYERLIVDLPLWAQNCHGYGQFETQGGGLLRADTRSASDLTIVVALICVENGLKSSLGTDVANLHLRFWEEPLLTKGHERNSDEYLNT